MTTDGKHLVGLIREGRFNKSILASCDAVALYPSIVIEEALDILEMKIRSDETLENKTDLQKSELIELTRIISLDPYFECEFGFFKQEGGTPMGGPLSRLLADLVIENKIESVIRAHEKWGKIWDWVRLIDDTLSAWESKEIFEEFFKYLNTIHPHIAWTCELEEEGKLPIFDILVIRTENGFETTVYRKSTHSNRYIHYTSAQAWKEKVACIKTLKKRALEYCSNEQLLADEFSFLIDIFEQN